MPEAQRHASAAHPTRAGCGRSARRREIRPSIPTDSVDGLLHQVEIVRVHRWRALGDEIAAPQNILLPKLVGIDAHLPGDAVHRALDSPCRLDLTRGPRVTRRHFIGIDAATLNAEMRNAI